MPRAMRIKYSGAVDQPMSRSDHREPVFPGDTDPKCFRMPLSGACVVGAGTVSVTCFSPCQTVVTIGQIVRIAAFHAGSML